MLDFVGSSGALSPVQPTPFEASASVQPVLALTAAGSAHRLNRRCSNLCVGSTSELYRAVSCAVYSRASALVHALFLGVFSVGVTPP